MSLLLTWIEGEEVGYRIVFKDQLRDVIEKEKHFIVADLETGKEITDLNTFIAQDQKVNSSYRH